MRFACAQNVSYVWQCSSAFSLFGALAPHDSLDQKKPLPILSCSISLLFSIGMPTRYKSNSIMDFLPSSSCYSTSYCDLNTKFNDRCYMDWSKTNLISIVTLEGIYILEPHLERAHGPYKIDLIRNPTSKFRHKISGDSDEIHQFDASINSLTNRQYLEIFLDSALSTNMDRLTNEHSYTRKFRSAKWSPVMNKFPKECLLAVITIDYQLLVYGRKSGTWDVLTDLSQDYDNIWNCVSSKSAPDKSPKTLDYESTRENLHAVSFCHICWDTRERHSSETNLNILAATMHGDLVIWQLSQETSQTCQSYMKAEIKLILRTRQANISCMQLHHGLLVASSRNGQVALYDLNVYLENMDLGKVPLVSCPNVTSSRQAATNKQSKQSATIDIAAVQFTVTDLPPTAVLWHQDNIEVMDFYLQAIDDEKSRMVLTKSTNICWCMIQYIKRTDTNSATLIVEDSFSAIDGLTPEVSLHQTPATWLRPANNKRAVLIAEDGSFFLLNFLEDNQDVSPSFSAISTGKIDLTDMIPRGVCVSPNGHLISMISSVTYMFDPVKLPAPTKLVTLPTQNDRQFLANCLDSLLDETWLQAKGIQSPVDVCDLIDYIRSLFPIWNFRQCDNLLTYLRHCLRELDEPRTETQILKLKIIGFLLLKLANHRSQAKAYNSNNLLASEQDRDLGLTICPMILFNEIQEISSTMLAKHTMQQFSVDQMNSLENYSKWMLLDCAQNDVGQFHQMRCSIRDDFRKKLNGLRDEMSGGSLPELCSICKAEIPFESALYAQCENGHRFVRCSRSLLTIDLRKHDEFQCEHCRRHYIMERVWPTSNLWPCLYCN